VSPVDLEHCLGIIAGKATPDVALAKLSDPGWQASYPKFKGVLADIAAWIDPALKI
jgi:hypothetical protein